MPLQALKAISKQQNGVGAFTAQIKRLQFSYCDFYGSSRGMNAYIRNHLASFAQAHPHIEINVMPRPNHHPVVTGYYINGREKAICVKNMEPNQIANKLDILKTANGQILHRTTRPVTSMNESVRGVWSPFNKTSKFKI